MEGQKNRMNETVSIIVPIYNVELYLKECLDSIVNQTYSNLEIITVDDGSIDKSPEILLDFANRDNRIIIIRKLNGGASTARNKGLLAATGKYILFVDSDDIIEENTIEILYERILRDQSEITLGSVTYLYPNGYRVSMFGRKGELNDISLCGINCFSELVKNDVFPPFVGLYLIKRNFLLSNRLFFEEGIVHEDELWCLKSLFYAKRVSLIQSSHLLYRVREGSIMNSSNMELRLRSYYIVSKSMHHFVRNYFSEIISKEVLGCVYIKIFRLFSDMMSLQFNSNLIENYISFFTDLLIDIYPDLSPYCQEKCLYWFRYATKMSFNLIA